MQTRSMTRAAELPVIESPPEVSDETKTKVTTDETSKDEDASQTTPPPRRQYTVLPPGACFHMILGCVIAVIFWENVNRLGTESSYVPSNTTRCAKRASFGEEGFVWQLHHSRIPEFEELRADWLAHFDHSDTKWDPYAVPMHTRMREILQRVPWTPQDQTAIKLHEQSFSEYAGKDRRSTGWYAVGGHYAKREILNRNTEEHSAFLGRYFEEHSMNNTGYFYYPPLGYREWHTNENNPIGWRLYYVHVDREDSSWLHYVPRVDESLSARLDVRRVPDRDGYYNLFEITKEPPFWHGVYSDKAHRFSVGLFIQPDFAQELLRRVCIDK